MNHIGPWNPFDYFYTYERTNFRVRYHRRSGVSRILQPHGQTIYEDPLPEGSQTGIGQGD